MKSSRSSVIGALKSVSKKVPEPMTSAFLSYSALRNALLSP